MRSRCSRVRLCSTRSCDTSNGARHNARQEGGKGSRGKGSRGKGSRGKRRGGKGGYGGKPKRFPPFVQRPGPSRRRAPLLPLLRHQPKALGGRDALLIGVVRIQRVVHLAVRVSTFPAPRAEDITVNVARLARHCRL